MTSAHRNPTAMFARHMSPPSQLAMLCMLALTLSPPGAWGCASTRGARGGDLDGEGHDALLKLEVSPPEAEVYIDGAYSGQISRWRDQSVPVHSGARRVELRAPDHITERFDVHIGAQELVTLTVALEPILDLPEAGAEEEEPPREQAGPPQDPASARSTTHRLVPDAGINP